MPGWPDPIKYNRIPSLDELRQDEKKNGLPFLSARVSWRSRRVRKAPHEVHTLLYQVSQMLLSGAEHD